MKNRFMIALAILLLPACVSSGLEPNWDVGGDVSRENSEFAPSSSGNYRVEVRRVGSGRDASDAGEGVIRMESFRNGVRVGGSSAASSTATQSRSHSTSFGVGRLGDPITILAGRDSFVVVLEGSAGNSLSARISQQSATSLTQGHSRGNALSTRIMTPLGRWITLGGIEESSDNTSTSRQLGAASSVSGRQDGARSQSALEIRVTPWAY